MKTERLYIRVTPEQKESLLSKAGGRTLSEYLLECALTEKPFPEVVIGPESIPQKKIVEKSPEKPVLAKQTVLVRSFFKEPKK